MEILNRLVDGVRRRRVREEEAEEVVPATNGRSRIFQVALSRVGDQYVTYVPAIDVASSGATREEALERTSGVIRLVLRYRSAVKNEDVVGTPVQIVDVHVPV